MQEDTVRGRGYWTGGWMTWLSLSHWHLLSSHWKTELYSPPCPCSLFRLESVVEFLLSQLLIPHPATPHLCFYFLFTLWSVVPGLTMEAGFVLISTFSPTVWPHDVKSQLIGKDPDAGKDWGREEKVVTEDEMVGWHLRCNGHEFEQTLGDGAGQGSLAPCSPRGRRVRHNFATEFLFCCFPCVAGLWAYFG